MSVMWIKEETSSQHAGVNPTSLHFLLFQSFPLADNHSLHGRDGPIWSSIFAPLFTTGQLRKELETETIYHWPDSRPLAGMALLFGLWDDFLKRGPSFPCRPGMGEVWFGASMPSPNVHRKKGIYWLHVWVTLWWTGKINCGVWVKETEWVKAESLLIASPVTWCHETKTLNQRNTKPFNMIQLKRVFGSLFLSWFASFLPNGSM